MNASVRNEVFAPVLFATDPALLVPGVVAYKSKQPAKVAILFALSGIIIVRFGGTYLTMTVNVPMNEALGAITLTQIQSNAEQIWAVYSPD